MEKDCKISMCDPVGATCKSANWINETVIYRVTTLFIRADVFPSWLKKEKEVN